MKYTIKDGVFRMTRIQQLSLLLGLGIAVAIFNFTAPAAFASGGAVRAATELRSILKTYLPSQPWTPFVSFAAIHTQLGEECGGGTTEITGLGPEVTDVASCTTIEAVI